MRKWIGLFVILPFVVLAGCGDSDDPPTGGGTPDNTAPEIAGVVGVDANHVQLTFSEQVKKETAERSENYQILETLPPVPVGHQASSPGDTIHIATTGLGTDGKTVTVTTWDAMGNLPYELSVTGVEDPSGNKITAPVSANFMGSNASDTTPPDLIARTPAPGATGVGVGAPVVVQFSEPMDFNSVQQAMQWTWASGTVLWQIEEEGDNTFVFRPMPALSNNTVYTVQLLGTAQDWAGNGLSGGTVTWNFTTTSQIDNTPPTLVSSTPTDGATNVAVSTNLQLNFSEAIDQTSLQDVLITPDPGSGVPVWSNGGQTVTFDPDLDLVDDTQYTLIILPGDLRDLAGNGSIDLIEIVWSTGSSLESGSISGVISGDPSSPAASNPEGALVIAADAFPFGDNDDFGVGGSGVVAANESYSLNNLRDGWYFPLAAMDSNGDGEIEPDKGDAIGLYGIIFGVDETPDSVQIVGGNTVTGIDFGLFDPMAIVGRVSYTGSMTGQYRYFVGAFDTTGLDLDNLPDPDFGAEGFWPFDPDYTIDELDEGMAPGTYYVGAYIDVNGNFAFDPAIDPAGLFGGLNSPTPITLTHGEDALDVDIVIVDPVAPMTAPPVRWGRTVTKHDASLRDAAAQIQRLLARFE